jgi:HK97 gp10 family phage protein
VAGKPAVKVSGAREFRAAMKAMGADLGDLTAINRAAAQKVADTARSNAPVLTGRLAGSVRAGATRTRGTVKAGTNGIPYAGVIHFGWPGHGIEPQPFIYDALDERKGEVIEAYEAHIEALVEKVARDKPP